MLTTLSYLITHLSNNSKAWKSNSCLDKVLRYCITTCTAFAEICLFLWIRVYCLCVRVNLKEPVFPEIKARQLPVFLWGKCTPPHSVGSDFKSSVKIHCTSSNKLERVCFYCVLDELSPSCEICGHFLCNGQRLVTFSSVICILYNCFLVFNRDLISSHRRTRHGSSIACISLVILYML